MGPKTLVQRRILSLLFIAIFVIVAPALIMIALGWTWDKKESTQDNWLPVTRAAAVNIKTSPRNTTFVITDAQDNVITSGTTPWLGLAMDPGFVKLTLSAPGYLNLVLQQTLRSGQGWQPAHLKLWPQSKWEPQTTMPEQTNTQPAWITRQKNNCITWSASENEPRQYCHTEPIISIGETTNGNTWFTSDRWLGVMQKTWSQPKIWTMEGRLLIAGYSDTYNSLVFVNQISPKKDRITAWQIGEDGSVQSQTILAEDTPATNYTWNQSNNTLYRKTNNTIQSITW